MKEFSVKIKPLTPIWTGDANRKCETLRETGIIGSLRWWYEALIRGLGGYACDPTDSKCDGKNHCDACELFGCNGWARKFRLQIATVDSSYAPSVIANTNPKSSKKPHFLGYYDTKGYGYEKNGGLLGEHELTFIVEKSDTLNLIKLLLKLAAEWGFGAWVQKGFGISHIEGDLNFSEVKIPINQNYPKKMDYRYPRMDQFFFYMIPFKNKAISKIREVIKANIYKTWRDLQNNKPLNETFSSYHYIPTSPWIRGAIRASFRDNDGLRHFIMGFVSVKGNPKPEEKEIFEKTGSKIFVSHIYDENSFIDSKEPAWRMKIWGWIPEIPDKIGVTREKVIEIIQKNIKKEDFWKNAFGLDENPVEIDNISEKWNVNPLEILKDGGGII